MKDIFLWLIKIKKKSKSLNNQFKNKKNIWEIEIKIKLKKSNIKWDKLEEKFKEKIKKLSNLNQKND